MKSIQISMAMLGMVGALLSWSRRAAVADDYNSRSSDTNGIQQSDQGIATTGAPSSATDSKHVTGTIKSIDQTAHTVTVKGTIFSKTFTFGTDAAFGGLNVGDKVDVTYHRQGHALIADEIARSSSSGLSSRQPTPTPAG